MEEFFILALVLAASFVGTLTGFGTSTILVSSLSLNYPLAETLLFAAIVHLFGDAWKMIFFKKGVEWKLILLFGVTGVVVSFFSARLTGLFPEEQLKTMLGLFLVTYVTFIFLKPKSKLPKTSSSMLLGGALSGLLAGLLGVGGTIRSAFLSAHDLNKTKFIFTSGAIGFLIDSSRITGYFAGGVGLSVYSSGLLIASIGISLAGAYLAKLVVDKIPQRKFRTVVAIGLFIVGIRYLY